MIRNVITNNLRVLSRCPDEECQLSDLSEAVMGLDDVGLPGVAATLADLIEPDEVVHCRDCVFFGEPDDASVTPLCLRDPDHTGRGCPTRENGFCAWARMRGDADGD